MNRKKFIWTSIEEGLELYISTENFPKGMHIGLLKEGEEFGSPNRRHTQSEIVYYEKPFSMIDCLIQRIIAKHSDAFGIVLPRDAVVASKMKKALADGGVEIPTYVSGIRLRRNQSTTLFRF